MRIPKPVENSEATVAVLQHPTYVGVASGAGNGIEPSFSLGGLFGGIVGKAGCIAGCGLNAIGCVHCGTDLGCWAKCAGPGAVDCISKCF